MSTSITSGTYPRARLPRFSLRRSLHTVWRALEAYGQRRAARHLEVVAMQRELSDPELAQELRRVAAECRAAR